MLPNRSILISGSASWMKNRAGFGSGFGNCKGAENAKSVGALIAVGESAALIALVLEVVNAAANKRPARTISKAAPMDAEARWRRNGSRGVAAFAPDVLSGSMRTQRF